MIAGQFVLLWISELPLVSLTRLIDYGCAPDPVCQDKPPLDGLTNTLKIIYFTF